MDPRERRLFVYDSLLAGEPDHELLAGARALGPLTTRAEFQLVDLGPYAAIVRAGSTSIVGELYALDAMVLARIDVKREVPILFRRESIELSDGTRADTYLMPPDQVRGRRRLARGDWRNRFAPSTPRVSPGPFVSWAKSRFSSR
jgi:gamma-glutamylaminecyclotransferase